MRKSILSIKAVILALVFSVGAVAAQAQCTYSLDMNDSFGDGWDGATMGVTVGGVIITGSPFTAAGVGTTITFDAAPGQEVILTYTSGSFENEHSWELFAEGGVSLFADGPNPTTGVVATFTSITGDPTFDLVDTFGDGWDGASIDYSVNAGVPVNITAVGSGSSFTVPMATGDIITWTYNSGSFENEHVYTFLGDVAVFTDGGNPTVGAQGVTYIKGCSGCAAPTNLTITHVSPTAVDLTWDNGQDGVTYDITGGVTLSGSVGVGTTTVSITGLTADTDYTFTVGETCGGLAGPTASVFTHTLCTAIATLPFVETFDTGSTTRDCWSQEDVSGTGAAWTYTNGALGGAISAAHTGDANARHTSTGGAEDTTKLVTPLLNLTSLTAPELTYWHGQEFWPGDQNTLTVYYRTSLSGPWVELVAEDFTDLSVWTEVTGVVLPSFSSATYQVAFQAHDTFGRAVVVDDVIIGDPPSCLDPSLVSATPTGPNSIDVSWTNGNTAPTTYNIICATCPSSPYTGTIGAGTTTVTISGLTAETTYSFDVSEDCTLSTGGASNSFTVGATTPCNTIVAPWTEDFEATSLTRQCWVNEYVAGTQDWFFSTGNGAAVSAAHSGTENARHSSSGGTDDVTKFVSPVVDISALATPSLFYWFSQEFWSPDQNTLTVYERTSAAAPWVVIADHSLDGSIAVWTENQVGSLSSSATYQVAFEGFDTFGRAVTLDDVQILDQPICFNPSGITCSVISDTEITVSWTNGQDNTAYDINAGTTTGTTTNDGSGITSVTITGLTPNTAYAFDLFEACGGLAGNSGTISCGATTLCSPNATMPFYETFEATSATRPCWTQEYLTGTQDWVFTSGALGGLISTANNGTLNAAFTSSGFPDDETYFISPMLDVTTLTNIELSFAHAQENWFGDQNELTITYRISPVDPWVTVINYNADLTAWTAESLVLPALANSATLQIGFLGFDTFGRRVILDDVLVQEAPPCLDPTLFTATVLSDTEIQLDWTNGQDNTTYNLSGGGTIPGGLTSNDGSGTTSVLVTGLTAATGYTFSLYEDCAADGGVGVSTTVTVNTTTLCAPMAVFPFTETFNTTSTTRDCWSNEQVGGTNVWVFTGGTSGGGQPFTPFEGDANASYTSSGAPFDTAKFVSPMFDISSLTTPEVAYYYAHEDWFGDQNTLEVFYRVSPADPWISLAPATTASVSAWTENVLALPAASAVYQLGFEGTDNFGRAVVLDQVVVREAPTCPDPSVISVTANAATGFDVQFTPGTVGSTAYVEYGPVGFVPGAGTTTSPGVITAAPTTIVVTGAASGELFDFYVYEDCEPVNGNGPDLSNPVGPNQTYTTGNPTACGINVAIPDNGCGTSTYAEVPMPVSVTGTQMGFDVALKEVHVIIEHTWSGDLDITLEDPNGTSVDLSIGNGGSFNNFGVPNGDCSVPTEFVMTATTLITAGTAPFPGPHVPEGDFADFEVGNPDPNGVWILRVCDGAGGDIGEIEFVELVFGDPPGCPNDPSLTATSAYTETSIDWTFTTDNVIGSTWFVEYGPSGFALGSGTVITGTNTGGPGTTTPQTVTGLASSTVYDFYFYENCGTAFNSNTIGPVIGYTLGNPTACGLGLPISSTLPDVVVEIPVTGYPGNLGVDFVLGEVNLLIAHTWDGDLSITLESPDGIVIDLTSGNGSLGDNYGDPTDLTCSTTANFRDDATVSVTAGSAPFTAEPAYIPEAPFGGFNGLTNVINGTWILTISDGVGGDDGTFEHAELQFELPPPCQDAIDFVSTAVGSDNADFSFTSWNAGDTWALEYGAPGYTAGTGTPGGTGTSVLGAGNTGSIASGLLPGTQYDVYLMETCGGDVSGFVGPVSIATIPDNDECTAAVPVSVSNTGYCQTFIVGSNVGATPLVASGVGDPTCSVYDGGDVWFSLIVPGSGDVTISTNFSSPQELTDIGIAAYDACGGTQLGCDDDSGPGFMSELALVGQTPGNTIYIRVWEYGNNQMGTFDICAFEPTTNAPINNFPCAAFQLNAATDCNYTIYANLNATTSITGSCTNGVGDVWFKVTVPASGTLVLNVTDFSMGDGTMTVHTITDCNDPGTWTEIACSDDEGVGLMPYLYLDADQGIAPGQEVYVRVAGFNGSNEGPFNICATQGIVWEGGTSTSYGTNSNWFQGGPEPVATENAIISSNATNPCIVNTVGESAATMWLNNGASFSVAGGTTFALTGDLYTNNSANDFGGGIFQMNGTSAQTMNTSFGTLDFQELMINNAAGVVLSPINGGGVVNINGVLDVNNGDFNVSAGNLTFVSNASGTAYLDDWNSITEATTGTVTGNVTVERYIAAAGYHHISSPVNSPDIPTQLSEYNPSGSNGVGVTPIGSAGAACSDTTLETGSNYGPIFEWQENAPGFSAGDGCNLWGWIVRSSGSMDNARGYAAQNFAGGAFTMNMTGTINPSPVTYATGSSNSGGDGNGFHLAGNPFACPITWGSVAGFAPFAYAWNDATGTYTSYPPGGVNFASSQGFFVQSTGGTSFTLNNSFKFEGDPAFLRTSTVWGDYSITIDVVGNGFSHFTTIGFADMLWGTSTCTNGWDSQCDAYALPGNSGQPFVYSMTTEGVEADPNRLQYNTQTLLSNVTRSVPVAFNPGSNGTFTFTVSDIESFEVGSGIVLEDTKLGVMHDLTANNVYTFSALTSDYDVNNPTNRFVVHFSPASVTEIADVIDLSAGFTLIGDQLEMQMNVLDAVEGTFTVLNAVGQSVISAQTVVTVNGKHTQNVGELANGVYVVRFITENDTYSGKFVKQ